MLNFGKRSRMKTNRYLIVLLLTLFACRPETPQAFSITDTPVPDSTFTAEPEILTTTNTATPTMPSSEPTATSLPAEPTPEEVMIPDPKAFAWVTVIDNLEKPVGIAAAGDGSGRLFVIEQGGVIRIMTSEGFLPAPFLDIQDRVGATSSERGLLGLAFHPDYTENGYFYVNYTDQRGDTIIARFQVSAGDLNIANPTSELQLLKVNQPFANHNGGGLAFGPDGYLYIGLGDGGSGGDPMGNAQDITTLLGKLLRIDVSSTDDSLYTIPPDNPFVSTGGAPEVWAYGLRNPWRFSFDRQTGDLYIGDVGQNQWEEVNFLPAGSTGGANFGWNYKEGTHTYQGTAPADLVDPVFEYDHSLGCSISGGVVYRGSQLPEWQGVYLFGDYCSGNVWGLISTSAAEWQSSLLYSGLGNITAFGEDDSGEIYAVTYGGSLLKLSPVIP